MKTVRKALDMLDIVKEHNGELNAANLAEKIGTNKTTAYKIAKVLCEYNYLQRVPSTTRYCTGQRINDLHIPTFSKADLLSIARPIMNELVLNSKDTSNLFIKFGTRGQYIEVIESDRSARLASSVGSIDYLHISAVGKILLSGMDEKEVDKIIEIEGLPKTGKNTITNPDSLKKELKKIRTSGYAFDLEESVVGARCVAAPIRDYTKLPIAAISISSLTVSTTNDELDYNRTLVVKAAETISQLIGRFVFVNVSDKL